MKTRVVKGKKNGIHVILMGDPATAKTSVGFSRNDAYVVYDDINTQGYSKLKLKPSAFKFPVNQEIQILIDSALLSIQLAKRHLRKNQYSLTLLRIKRALSYINKAKRILNC